MPGDIQKVRPLGDSDATAAKEPPRLLLVAVVLLIGVLAGWGFSASRDEPTATRETGTTETASPQTLTDVPDPEPVPEGIEVDWQEATEVPPIPDGYEYGGTSGPVTLDGAFYLMVRFRDVENGSLRNELWISDDAVSWRSEVLDLGEQAEVIGLAATNDDLVITANGANGFFMWTSTAGVSGDRSSWEPVDLQLPPTVPAR